MCVEMVDAAVGVDTVVEPSCHAAVQTCGFPSHSIACQTIFTTHNTCAVQTDDITILHTANNASHPDGQFGNFKLSEKETTCSTAKYKKAETVLSRRVNTEATNQTRCATDSLLPSTGKVKMLSVSTSACVEMLDATVGVDTVAEPSCPVPDVTSYRIACQTGVTDKDTCVAQMNDVTTHHTADSISYPEDKLGNCKLLEGKSTCSVGKKQHIETKLCRNITTDAAVQAQCLSDNGVLNNCNLNSYGALIKDAEKERFCSVTSKQSVEIKSKNQGTMIRCDYEKPEKCLREELKKWQSLVAWLCSNKNHDSTDEESPLKSDDSSVPAPKAQSRTNKLLTQQSIPSADKQPTQQSTDKLLMKEIIPASSGSFAVEGIPFSSCYCKRIHPDEWLMPVVPCFQCHMSPLLFQPKLRNCHKNAVIGACPNMNQCCVSQTAHTHQEVENCCCCLCVKTNHSNHKPHECEKVMQLSHMRSTSDKKSAKQSWKRNVVTEDLSDGWETGDNRKVPSRKIFGKRPRINSTSNTETDSEIENTGLRRRGICAEKQDSCMGVGPGRKVTRKQLWKRRKVAHNRSKYSQIGMNERKKYRTARSRKISTCLKEKHLQSGSSSDTQQHASTCSRFQKRKSKHNEDHKKDCRKCISEKMLGKNSPLSKLKHRSEHLMCGQLNEHTENSDTSVTKVCSEFSEFHTDQSDIESVKDFQAESCSTRVPNNLQSNAVQKTETLPQEDKRKHLSCIELFGDVSDISLDEEQQSGRIAAQMQTVQPRKASGSSSNRRKRRAQVESRTTDCASFEMQNSKRTKIGFVNKENNVSVTSEVYETVSNIMLHSVSESNPEKCNAKTCKASTGISLASGEQMHLDQDCDISTANGSSLMLEHQLGACKTRQAAGKTDVSQGVGPRRKPSKLEKLRRNLIRAKMPSKIATDKPIKSVQRRKKLTPRGEASCVGSESNRPGEKNISEIAREDEMPNSFTATGNLSYRPLHQNIPALIVENENSPTKHDTTAHNMANWLVNNHDNSVDNHQFTCNSVTSQICSSTYVTSEPDNETNRAVDVSKSFASKDNVSDAEILGCSQDIPPIRSHVSISEIQTNSSSTDGAPETVKVLALPISYKENMSEASQISENVGLVTLPNTYIEASTRLETMTQVCSQNMSFETCQAAVDCKDVKSPATVLRIGELEDIMCPNVCQESLPCPVSLVKDTVMDEPQLNSKANEQLISTPDTIQVAELPVDGLSINSPERLTGSSMHKQSDKQIAMKKSTVTKKTDEKLFAGCVLQWGLKDYEVEYKKKNLKKSKSMMGQLKVKG
jgi:hypothetical protein